jgi:hypothetical protein
VIHQVQGGRRSTRAKDKKDKDAEGLLIVQTRNELHEVVIDVHDQQAVIALAGQRCGQVEP